MDSLYSRYVPPKKKQKIDSAAPPVIPVPERISSLEYVLPTKSDASPTYKRYVPSSNRSRKSSSTVAPEPAGDIKLQMGSNLGTDNGRPGHVRALRTTEEAVNHHVLNSQTDTMDLDTPATSQRKRKKREKLASGSKGAGIVVTEREKKAAKHVSMLARREKSLRNAEKLAKKATKKMSSENGENENKDVEMEEPAELHALEPLPQPEMLPESNAKPSFSSLPPWLVSPIRVSPAATASFSDLGIRDSAISGLAAKGFNEAFAVQAAILPLLLPGPRQQPGDILVSAATGSGKTLAYVLPMIEDISKTLTNRLSGLIVMPTRELVSQAKEVCDICAIAFSNNRKHVKTGIAFGSQNLKKEQATLMDREQFRDPLSCLEEEDRRPEWKIPGTQPSEDEDEDEAIFLTEGYGKRFGELRDVRLIREETSSTLYGDDLGPRPKVNILICTPGRLVEHIKATPGFTLQYLKWLVIDEADKLLNQSFQEWVETIMDLLPSEVTKIVLSATMTRDVGQLSSLKLYRPKLVVLEGERNEDDKDLDGEAEDGKTHALPATLYETAIKVDEEADKPLYLLELLKSQRMVEIYSDSFDDTSTSEDSSSDEETSSSSSSSESDSSGSDSKEESSIKQSTSHASALKSRPSKCQSQAITEPRGVLIFTKSNENALRLSRLLTLIDPSFANVLGTLTSTIPMTTRRKTLASFQSGKISVLVASDLVSRGLDLPGLAHVVNYDIPSSLPSYVHRVGRTARAGRKGNAWTLFTNTEARWFWNEIARSDLVNRDARKVVRFRIDAESFGVALRLKYEKSLETLGQEARNQK